MPLQWKDAYIVGNDEIDAQHQQLFSLVNDLLCATDKVGLTNGAMALFKYTREHFALEEQLMKRINYPAMAKHMAQHDGLLSRLSEIAGRIANETLNREVLETFLSDWLLNHIATADSKLAVFIQLQQSTVIATQ